MTAEVMAVVDFETTGLSPNVGSRAIEIAVVLVSAGRIVDSYASLMNPGISVPAEITAYTGITTKMVKSAPAAQTVIREATKFIGKAGLVAHNASFDSRFLEAEHRRLGISQPLSFICTMLLSRRIFCDAPNYKLGTLVKHLCLPCDGNLHRALADAMVTAELLVRLQSEISARCGITPPHRALAKIQRTPRKSIDKAIQLLGQAQQE